MVLHCWLRHARHLSTLLYTIIQHEIKQWNIDKVSSFFSQNQPENTSTSAVIFCPATTWTPNKSCTTKQPAVVLLLCPLPFLPSRLAMLTQMTEQVLSSCHQWIDAHLLIFHKIYEIKIVLDLMTNMKRTMNIMYYCVSCLWDVYYPIDPGKEEHYWRNYLR